MMSTGGSLDERWAIWRKGLDLFGNLYARMILRMPIQDVTGGFRAWKIKDTLRVYPFGKSKIAGIRLSGGDGFYNTLVAGFSMKEIPIYFADTQTRGDSNQSLKYSN